MLSIELGYFVKQHGSTRILIDLSATNFGLSADDLRELFDLYVEYQIPTTTRSAIAIPGQLIQQGISRLLQISKRYGFEVGFFDIESEARGWLQD